MSKLLFNRLSPFKTFWLIFRYSKCAECGSRLVGNGEGSFTITEKHFKRECKCGCTVVTGFAVSNKI